MADIDIDQFGGLEWGGEPDRTDENIALPLVPLITPVGGSTWEPELEQETSFGGKSQRTSLMKDYVKDL